MKILLIDDSSLSRNLLKRALGSEHQFVEANDGMRGLELYYIEHPELVILDLTMPGVNGMDILQQLRQIDPKARVIIGTADIQEYSRQRANELGASAYLNKPFTQDAVREVVRRVIEESEDSAT